MFDVCSVENDLFYLWRVIYYILSFFFFHSYVGVFGFPADHSTSQVMINGYLILLKIDKAPFVLLMVADNYSDTPNDKMTS